MQSFVEFVIRNRITVLALTALVTLALLTQLWNLSVIIDPDETLPQGHPFVAATNRVEALFGSKYTVVIAVSPRSGDVFQEPVLAKVRGITADLLAAPGVVTSSVASLAARRAKSITGADDGLSVRPLMDKVPRSAADLEALRRRLDANPVFADMIVSGDGATAAIIVEFRKADDGFTGIERTVRGLVAPYADETVDIAVAGQPLFLALLERYSGRMVFLVPLSILIIGLIHFEAFRTLQGLVLPLVTALFALIWALGLMSVARVPLDAFNATTPILILAIAAGHAVQILKRYYEEYAILRRDTALDPVEANRLAVLRSIGRIGPVMMAACLVAAGSFMSLVAFDIKTIRTFGVFSGVGVVSILIIELTFIPALRSLLPPPGLRETERQGAQTPWDRLALRMASWMAPAGRRRILLFAAVFTAAAAGLGSQVGIDNALRTNFFAGLDTRQEDVRVNARLAGTNTLYVLIEGAADDAIKDPRVLKAMDATQRFLADDPKVGKSVSIADHVRRINRAMNGDDPSFDTIPDSGDLISQYLLLYAMSGEPGDFDSYVDYGYRNAVIAVYVKDEDSAYVEGLIGRLRAFVGDRFGPDVRVSIGGNVTAMIALTEVMVRGQIEKIAVIASIVFLISSILFRSLWIGLLILVPLVMTVLASLGLMQVAGIPLNVATSVTLALAVGIGADYAIYLTYRLREHLDQGESEDEAVRNTFVSAGKAILFVATAVSGGYAVLLGSYGFHIHIWIAVLIGTAMLISSLSAMTVFPALLLTVRPGFVFGGAKASVRPATLGVLMLAAGLSVMAPTARAEAPTAETIARMNFAVGRVLDSGFTATFRLINGSGQERLRETRGQTKLRDNGVDSMRLTRFLAPADVKDTTILMIENSDGEDDIWIYLPALKKVRRLAAANKRDAFVGTDFSFGDIIGHKVQDWTHRVVREEAVDGQPCFVMESVPVTAAVQSSSGYSRRIGWIRKDNHVTIKAQFFDEAGQLLKTFGASDVQLVDAERQRWQPMRMESRNEQTGHRTIIEMRDFKASQGIDPAVFSLRSLERLQ